jgi:hypothetical protein
MHFIPSPYEEMYHHVRELMCVPCGFQRDKCQVGNMHIYLGEISSFYIIPSSLLPLFSPTIQTLLLPSPYMYLERLALWTTRNMV